MKKELEFDVKRMLNLFESKLGNVKTIIAESSHEEIKEDDSVIIERLQKLWDECDNFNHYEPLKKAAKKYNYEFPNRPGEKIKE